MPRGVLWVCLVALGILYAGVVEATESVALIRTFGGEAHPGGLGYPARDVGDFNGDGYADFAAYTDEASVNVYLGGAALDTIPDLVLREDFCGGFDTRMAGRCDFNGDGYDDLVVSNTDSAVVYLGGDPPDAEADLIFPHGFQVAGLGDVNADSLDDFAVGMNPTLVYFGSAAPGSTPEIGISTSW